MSEEAAVAVAIASRSRQGTPRSAKERNCSNEQSARDIDLFETTPTLQGVAEEETLDFKFLL